MDNNSEHKYKFVYDNYARLGFHSYLTVECVMNHCIPLKSFPIMQDLLLCVADLSFKDMMGKSHCIMEYEEMDEQDEENYEVWCMVGE